VSDGALSNYGHVRTFLACVSYMLSRCGFKIWLRDNLEDRFAI